MSGKAELVEQIQQLEHDLDEVKKQQAATPTHLDWEALAPKAQCERLARPQTVAGHGEDDRLPSGGGVGRDHPGGISPCGRRTVRRHCAEGC